MLTSCSLLEMFTSFNNIFFSDKAHFHLNGHLNRQNCRYWSDTNPKWSIRNPCIHPRAALSARGIIGPHVYEDRRGISITVNTEQYIAMLLKFFAPLLQDSNGFSQQPWLQRDEATCHTSNDSLSSVCEIFGYSKEVTITGQLVARTYPQLIFFLWGYLKRKFFKINSELKKHICKEMLNISRNTCQSVSAPCCSSVKIIKDHIWMM